MAERASHRARAGGERPRSGPPHGRAAQPARRVDHPHRRGQGLNADLTSPRCGLSYSHLVGRRRSTYDRHPEVADSQNGPRRPTAADLSGPSSFEARPAVQRALGSHLGMTGPAHLNAGYRLSLAAEMCRIRQPLAGEVAALLRAIRVPQRFTRTHRADGIDRTHHLARRRAN